MHYLLGYKIKDGTVVFSRDALSKVIDSLKRNSINFEIVNESRYRFLNNNYQGFLLKAYEAYDKELRINDIVKKIDRLDNKRLDALLHHIEVFLHESGF